MKIPRMLKKRFGENLQVELVSGTDFPDERRRDAGESLVLPRADKQEGGADKC